MAVHTYTIQDLESLSGVAGRTLRHWIRQRLLPKPLGRGRAARYDERHLVRAKVIVHLRKSEDSLQAIRNRLASLTEEQLVALVPRAPRVLTPEGVPVPPPATTYPFVPWEVVQLMDGMVLMLNTNRGPGLRRVADEIYRYYGTP